MVIPFDRERVDYSRSAKSRKMCVIAEDQTRLGIMERVEADHERACEENRVREVEAKKQF